MARALFLSLHPDDQAASAGTRVDRDGESLLEYALRNQGHSFVIPAMEELGLDMRSSRRRQLTRSELENFDLIVSMAERITEPSWLTSHANYVRWEVPDPGGESLVQVLKARDLIVALLESDFPTRVSSAA